jgi:hypothetical protein
VRVASDAARKAEFLVARLEDVELLEGLFDKIFAVRVGLIHREPERAATRRAVAGPARALLRRVRRA